MVAVQRSALATRVRHNKFGLGTVLREAAGKTVVRFDDGSERTLGTTFLAIVEG